MHYWASPIEARLCAGQEVALVGAGNSAGQAAVYLASQAQQGLDDRARHEPGSHHVALSGRPHRGAAQHRSADAKPRSRRWKARTARSQRCAGATATPATKTTRPIRHLFLFIGADPNTDWLARLRRRARRQGLRRAPARTGSGAAAGDQPHGVFAIGDVRSGSVKRVAAAVGEGAQVVAALHAYLARGSASAQTDGGSLMADDCTHLRHDPDGDAERARLRGMPEDRLALGASAALPHLRPCRLLRPLAQPPRHQAFPRHQASRSSKATTRRKAGAGAMSTR